MEYDRDTWNLQQYIPFVFTGYDAGTSQKTTKSRPRTDGKYLKYLRIYTCN